VDFYLLTTAQSGDAEEPSSARYPYYGDHTLPVHTSLESKVKHTGGQKKSLDNDKQRLAPFRRLISAASTPFRTSLLESASDEENGHEGSRTKGRPKTMSEQEHTSTLSEAATPEQGAELEGTQRAGEGLGGYRIPLGEQSTRSLSHHGAQTRYGTWCVGHRARQRAPPTLGSL
jgi:hypothetical protein